MRPCAVQSAFALICDAPGMALAPWNVLGAGKIRTDAEEERRRQTGEKGAWA